jgi:hypothetical protein
MEKNQFQLVYFPYIFFGKFRSVSLLGVTLWNAKEIIERIDDLRLKDKIGSLIKQNRTQGNPIRDIAVFDFSGNNTFLPTTNSEKNKTSEIRILLFLACMAKNNIHEGPNVGHLMQTSDNYKVVYQNFKLNSPHTGYIAGVIVRLNDFGYKIDDLTYEKPHCVLTNDFSYDEQFLNILERLRRKNRKCYRLILRSAESVMNAYTNSDDISVESRILEFSRAFEILLGLPERNQRKIFKEKIKNYCESSREKKWRYSSERPGGTKDFEHGSQQVIWADRFYTLRNHIIHGEKITKNRLYYHGQEHHQLALWFFLVSVKKIINEALRKKYFYDFIKYEDSHFVYDRGLWESGKQKLLEYVQKTLKV